MVEDRPLRGLAAEFASTFVLTLTAPSSILAFAAVFAGIGLGEATGNYWAPALLVTGVFLGSILWSILLCSGIGLLRRALTPARLRWVDYLSGAALAGFGLLALLSLSR